MYLDLIREDCETYDHRLIFCVHGEVIDIIEFNESHSGWVQDVVNKFWATGVATL